MSNQQILYQRNPAFIFRKIVDETVLVPIHNDVADMQCIYTLSELGAFIWDLLENPTSFADLQAKIIASYDAEAEVIAADLEVFLQEMVSIGAVGEA